MQSVKQRGQLKPEQECTYIDATFLVEQARKVDLDCLNESLFCSVLFVDLEDL